MKNLILTAFLLTTSVWFSACAEKKIVHGGVSHQKLFPYGNYRHQVSLVLPAQGDAPEKRFEFTGVVQLKPEAIHVVVFSFMGTTAFKINEDLPTGAIQTEIYVAQLKKFEPRLKEYYVILRQILIADDHPPAPGAGIRWVHTNAQGQPDELRTVGLPKNATFKLQAFDANGIPARFVIEHPNFTVHVEVKGYEI